MKQELIRAICENPDDTNLRLVYADFIESENPKLAEFIRVQCAIEDFKPVTYNKLMHEVEWRSCKRSEDEKFILDAPKNRIGVYYYKDYGEKTKLLQTEDSLWMMQIQSNDNQLRDYFDSLWQETKTGNIQFVMPYQYKGTYDTNSSVAIIRRGFIEEIHCTEPIFQQHGPVWVKKFPLTYVKPTDIKPYHINEYYSWWLRTSQPNHPRPTDADLYDLLRGGAVLYTQNGIADWREYQTEADAYDDLSQALIRRAKLPLLKGH